MKRDRIIYIFFLLLSVALVGCRSTKQVAQRGTTDMADVKELLAMQAFKPIATSLTAKMDVSLVMASKPLDAGGTIKMERGAGVQLGITALGLFELARLEISPFDVQFLNKFNKEYAALSYTDVGFLQQTGLNYKMLEAVFMNELFSYNDASLDRAVYNMQVARSGDEVVLTTPKENGMQYRFFLKTSTGELVKTEGTYNNDVSVVCSYSDFQQLETRSFPRRISIVVTGVDSNLSMDLKLSNIKTDTFGFKKSNVSSYKKMDLSTLLKEIGK